VRKRHQPLRTCVICGRKGPKRGLARIAATPDGVALDREGRAPGRGAYVCGDDGCAGVGLQRKRLEFALRKQLTDPQWREIASSIGASGPVD
jgi:predicted RNA-binding protein YlxR (DUF448 family)